MPPVTTVSITGLIQGRSWRSRLSSSRKTMGTSAAVVAKPCVAFTTPSNYSSRISQLLSLKGFAPLWCPTITIHSTPHSLKPHLTPPNLETFSAIAFTSRTGINSVLEAVIEIGEPLLSSHGDSFIISALGKDCELLDRDFVDKLCDNFGRVKVLIPSVATPSCLVELLGVGNGRRVLCPVPRVVGLSEPPVVPKFLRELEAKGWVVVRVDAYETAWGGPQCAKELVEKSGKGELDAIVFTSSAEVEGLLKSLRALGWDWKMVKESCPRLVVAAHGPVTAAGAELLGIEVDLVSSQFDSFHGVVDALALRCQSLE